VATELSLLIPEFRKKLIDVLEACKQRGFQMQALTTIISPFDQATYWKQGRSATDAELKAMALANNGAKFLADCMIKAVAKETNLVTDELPGCTWYQWGEAATVAWIDRNRKINTSSVFKEHPSNQNGYQVFAEECAKVGLHQHRFNTAQFRPEQSPLDVYTLTEIDAEMRKRYGR
jgi:hypothetical protein